MKIKPEHFAHMLTAIKEHENYIPAFRQSILAEKRAKDMEMRLRWDMLYCAISSKWICDVLYPYVNDDHIDTALKSIMKQLVK